MSSIVKSGYRPHSDRAAQAFALEVLRDQHEDMARKYSRLRGALVDWFHNRGLENEDAYLARLKREAGIHP